MSHVAELELDITSLELLEKACTKLGLELVKDQKHYRWYGTHMKDYPLPAGFSAEGLGKCEHAIRVKGADEKTYEMGVVKRRDGRSGYQLLFDFWQGGFGLIDKIGENGGLLKQHYSALVAKRQMLREGYRVSETTDKQGNILLTFTE